MTIKEKGAAESEAGPLKETIGSLKGDNLEHHPGFLREEIGAFLVFLATDKGHGHPLLSKEGTKVISERNSIEKKAFETPLFFAEGKRMKRMEKSQKGQTEEIVPRMALRQEEERSFGAKETPARIIKADTRLKIAKKRKGEEEIKEAE